MPELHFPFLSLCQTLENDTHLVEAFSFPEVIRFGSNPVRLREGLIRSLLPLLEQMPPGEVHRRLPPLEPVGGWVRLELSPPPQDPAWRTPVELTFPYLLFPHGPHRLAWVPTLGLVVVGAAPDQVEGRLVPEIRAELARRRASSSLASLGWLQRCRELSWHSEAVRLRLKSPREFLALEQPAEKRVLPEVATDLGANPPEPAFEMEADLARLARALGGTRPRSVLLVGPSGVGKTALVGELARRRAEFGLGATPFYETSGARLMAGSHGFGAWQDRCRKLWREVSSERAVLVLGNLVELMEVGRSADNPGGVAGFFRPHLARGELQAVAECTPEQLSHIELRDPHLLQAFWILRLEEPEPARARAILGRCARAWGPQEEDLEPLLAEVDRLHRRYATCSAYPGRPLRFLRTLLQGPGPWTARRATEEFSHETGLPLWLLDEGIPLDLEATRRWLAERVLGQPEAV
ncbi:MAG TPA: AAA family ATPase, partial [Candidatus Nitrosotenuis sp.]|nr:AAA family ATPase [Candidatus Nitrosotenuis sp.]